MSYACKILADSVAPNGVRLTTMQIRFPRIVLAEFNTHRVFSRNSASSRAIPVEKRIAAVRADPFIPAEFCLNQKGMSAGEALEPITAGMAARMWLAACDDACRLAADLALMGVHKQWANRLIEPFSWHEVIVTATEWANFFALRISPHAQPEIRTVAVLMKDAMENSVPVKLAAGQWHLPLVDPDDMLDGSIDPVDMPKLSTARCARVSYLTHDGKRDVQADLRLHDQLLANGHMSPFEHAAKCGESDGKGGAWEGEIRRRDFGNFVAPWIQYRKLIPNEDVYRG